MEKLSRSQTKALKAQRDALELAMEHGPTRRFMRSLLDACGVFAPNTSVGPEGVFLEGQRSVGLSIMAEMNEIDPHMLPKLLQDGANELIRSRVDTRKQETMDV